MSVPNWIDLGPLADFPDPGARDFSIDGHAGLLVRAGSLLRAWRNRCPHIGGLLTWQPPCRGDSPAAATPIRCTLHGALFAPDSGACIRGPCQGDALTALPISVRDGRIWLAGDALDED